MVSLPESSHPLPDGWPPKPGPAASGAQRRKRREDVEKMLVDGARTAQICEAVSAKWGVSARTVKSDVAHVMRRWDRDDRRYANQARQRVLKRLERCATRLEERGEHAEAALVHYRIGRLRGMGSTLDVAVNVRGRVEHAHLPADPKSWLAAFSAGLAELGLLMPGASVPAEVIQVETADPAKNGHEHNGSAA